MAVIALLEHEEVKAMLRILDKTDIPFTELHEQIVNKLNICSTSTLYRRAKELELADIIRRADVVSLTDYGRKLYSQAQHKDEELELQMKHYRLLKEVEKYPRQSTTYLVSQVSVSPNEMIDILRYLEKKGYIRIISVKSGKGRPKKVYELTEEGQRVKREITKLLKEGERK